VRHGWGKIGSPFLKAFSSLYIPEGTKEQLDSLVDLQKLTTSPANAVKLRTAADNFDVSGLLDKVDVPTLVFHAQNDGVHPLEQGRELAAGIRGAKFILLDSSNHAILEHEPAWSALHQEIRDFVLG
jgi:pimeloyl-ACP methyl ester carboxylesterase